MAGRIIRTIIILAVVAAAAYGGWRVLHGRLLSPEAAQETIPTHELRSGTFQASISTIGSLRAATSQLLSAPFEGKIIKILPEGTRVKPGDPVMWFETQEYEDDLEEEEAQLNLDRKDLEAAQQAYELEKVKNQYTMESEKTNVEIARQRFEDAKRKYESELKLFEREIVPRNNVDSARLQLLQAELSLQNAQINLAKVRENLEANLRIKEREIDKARLRMEKTQQDVEEDQRRIESAVVVAQSSGDLSYLKMWKSGSVGKVAEGDNVWRMTALLEIPDPSVMLAVVPVSEIDISRVEQGQSAEVYLEAIPGKVFTGVVEAKSIVPISDPTQQSWGGDSGSGMGPKEFEVRVRLDESTDLMRQGMTASVRIIVAELEDALSAPLEALVEQDGRKGLWVLRNDEPRFIPVEIELTNDNFAAVKGEVNEGDLVLLAPPSAPASPGEPLQAASPGPGSPSAAVAPPPSIPAGGRG